MLLYIVCYYILIFLLFSNSINCNSSKDVIRIKDYSLSYLIDILKKNNHIFQEWDTNNITSSNINDFINTIDEWITTIPIINTNTITNITLNCINTRYSNVLTGSIVKKPKVIIDFIPFGYDVDKLLIRLIETYDVVDIFVIYECPYTLIGLSKAYYFRKIIQLKQFKKYIDKIVYFYSTNNETQYIANIASNSIGIKFNNDIFAVELFMAKEMIRIFKTIFLSDVNSDTFKVTEDKLLSFFNTKEKLDRFRSIILREYKYILAIQNDGDEIVSGQVLYHLKHCQVKADVESIYTPSFGFKHNFNWMIRSLEMDECFQSANDNDKLLDPYLKQFLWNLGPVLWPLHIMIDNEHNMRRMKKNDYCIHHMGLGAAVHISASNDPVENWMKNCATIEGRLHCLKFSKDFVNGLKSGNLTSNLLFESTIHPFCSRHNYIVHKNSLQIPRKRLKGLAWINENDNEKIRSAAIQLINDAIPKIVRLVPSAFPFLIPTFEKNSTSIFKVVDDVNWASHCTGKDSTHRTKNGAVIEFLKYLSPFQMNFNMQ